MKIKNKKNTITITKEEFIKKAMNIVAKEGNDTEGIEEKNKEEFSFAKTMMGMMIVMEIAKNLFEEEDK